MREQGATPEARRGQKLLIGPWQHGSSRGPGIAGDHYFGLGSDPLAIDLDGVLLRWFDCWLKGANNGIMDEPPVRLFVMGDNVWRDEREWPLARAQSVKYYLHSQGRANSLNGDGALSPQPPAGIRRARSRDSTSTPSLVEPGRAYGYMIDLWATSNVFKAGHRIRVEISSSNFPRFDRNPNTGRRIAEDAELQPALQTILHSAQYPSHITLPIVPR